MKHLFIINPLAGKRGSTASLEKQIRKVFANRDFEILYTEYEGHGEILARDCVRTGVPVRIYACGGDGTLNEVVNGAAGFENAAITNVPIGTGNDFLKIFGSDCLAAFSDLNALADGPQAAFDLIDCNGKLGIDIVCTGIDARVAADVHGYKRLPFLSGSGAYILALIVNVLFKKIACPMRVEFEGAVSDLETSLLCICNGRYYGGGFMPVGEAMPDDGVLNMLHVRKVSLFTFARLVGAYAKGRYKEFPQYIRPLHGTSVRFSSPTPLATVVDGEVMWDTEFEVRLSEKKINFFWPAHVDYHL